MKFPRYFPISLLLMLQHVIVSAQTPDFVPAKEDVTAFTSLTETCKQRYAEDLKLLPGKNKKDYQEIYELRWKRIKERLDNHELYMAPVATAYLDRMVAEVVEGNPVLSKLTFNCYFSKDAVPNASYIGEGIILFNMGLFSRLRTESEAAFVLCHEISHCLLRHPENGIDKYVQTVNSAEIQRELRKIKGSEYRKREQLEKMVKGLKFDSRRHSRDHEAQADSMAFELMRHTRFAVEGALTGLALLDIIDSDSLATSACLQQLFNAPAYPFQQKWLLRNEGLLGGHAKLEKDAMADSLKTHPDCQQRIALLKPFVAQSGQGVAGKAFPIDSSTFRQLQGQFRYEAISFAFDSKDYTQCLFLCLQAYQIRPGDAYLVSQIGKVMNGIYAAQKSHTLGNFTSLPSPYYPSNYNMLLQFVQNLYLENITQINFNFLKQYHPRLDHYTPFKEAYVLSEKNNQIQ